MEDFGGFEAGDAWDADEAEPVDPDAFPCFLNPVAGFTPRSEVEARAAERYVEDEDEDDDEERRAPRPRGPGPSGPAAPTRPARRGGPQAPPRPDAAQRHAADPTLPPPAVAGRLPAGVFTEPARGAGFVGARRKNKNADRSYRRGVERFCSKLLSWSVLGLAEREHDPTAVGLAPLPEPVKRFESKEHYFDVQNAVALEEARAALARRAKALREALLEDAPGSRHSRSNTCVRVTLRAVEAREGRKLESSEAEEVLRAVEAREKESPRKEFPAAAAAASAEWRRPGTVLAIRRIRADGARDEPELAIVTHGNRDKTEPRDNEKKRTNGAAEESEESVPAERQNGPTVSLWMARGSSRESDAFFPETADAYVLDTVVSQMRIAAAAHTRPNPPWMHELLGVRRAGAHVRFASDDDDDDDGVREKNGSGSGYADVDAFTEAKKKNREARLELERARHESLALGTPLTSLNDAQRRAGCLFAEKVLEKRGSFATKRVKDASTKKKKKRSRLLDVDRRSEDVDDEDDDDDDDEEEDDDELFDASISTTGSPSSSRRLHLVQGPPGCGKTRFVAATLRALVDRRGDAEGARTHEKPERRFRVLLCAPSNKAVTVALEKFLAEIDLSGSPRGRSSLKPIPLLVGVEEALEQACAREGSSGEDTEFVEIGDHLPSSPRERVMDFFVHRRCGVLADRLARRAASLLERLDARRSSKDGVDSLETETREVSRSVLATLRGTMAELERVAPAFVAADGFRAKARRTETLVGEVANDADFFAGVLDGPKKQKRHQKNEQKRLLRDEIQTALRETCSMLREGSGRGKHSDLFAEQAVSRADVVFATLSSSGQAVVSRAENFDALIVDEAAQALECELVVALARKPKRCLLVGDPAQLPATMASETARRKGHDRSCMRRVLDVAAEDEKNFNARRGAFGNARDATVAPLDSWYTLLDTQYRMHPAISSFPSRRFYASRVRDAGSTQTVPFFLRAPTYEGFFTNGAEERQKNAALRKWLKAPFAFVDVPFQAGSRSETRGSSGFLSRVSRTKGDKNETPSGSTASLGNDAEAELAAALARALPRAMGRAPGSEASSATPKPKSSGSFSASDSSDDSSDDARRRTDDSRGGAAVHVVTSAVITFYSEQVRRVRRELAARGSLANAVAGSENGSVAAKKKTNRKKTKPPADRRAAHFPPPAVHTVDAFQGSEADVVVISAVRCNARGDVGFLADPRRLNVALTRAKSVCVFVGCVRTLRASGNPDLLALVRDSESRGLIATEAEARAWLELHK